MKKRTREGAALTELILESFKFNGAMLDAGNQLTKPCGLTSARWQVMGAIDWEGQALTVAQVARRMGLTRQGVQRIVNDLVNLDMVVLNENLDHKRAPLVSISDKGASIMKEIDRLQADWVNKISDSLSEKQINETLELLVNIRQRSELIMNNDKK